MGTVPSEECSCRDGSCSEDGYMVDLRARARVNSEPAVVDVAYVAEDTTPNVDRIHLFGTVIDRPCPQACFRNELLQSSPDVVPEELDASPEQLCDINNVLLDESIGGPEAPLQSGTNKILRVVLADVPELVTDQTDSFRDSKTTRETVSSRTSKVSAKSKTTQALRDSAKCEWWMLVSTADNKVRQSRRRSVENFQLQETWCGSRPIIPDQPRTPYLQRGFCAPLRTYSAGRRHRYQWNGFDLDLAYITSRVIAMGFPGKGRQVAIRNPHSEVRRFLESYHGNDFRIYNLCVEKKHANNGFPDHTVNFPCADHAPPTFASFLEFCTNVEEWLRRSPEHVAAVHCKAGKGRTGTMICALLLFSATVASAYDALRWYELTRGGFRSGVTIPTQIRWVAMFERWITKQASGLRHDPVADPIPHRLKSLRLGPLHPEFLDGTKDDTLLVRVGLASRKDNDARRVTYWYPHLAAQCDGEDSVSISLPEEGPIWRESDGRMLLNVEQIKCCLRDGKTRKLKMGIWWHCAFLQSGANGISSPIGILDVGKAWIDGLHKDLVKNKKAPRDLRLVATFVDVMDG